MAVASNRFLFDVDDRQVLQDHQKRLLKLVSAVPFVRLDYPRRFESLPQVCELITAHAKAFL